MCVTKLLIFCFVPLYHYNDNSFAQWNMVTEESSLCTAGGKKKSCGSFVWQPLDLEKKHYTTAVRTNKLVNLHSDEIQHIWMTGNQCDLSTAWRLNNNSSDSFEWTVKLTNVLE